ISPAGRGGARAARLSFVRRHRIAASLAAIIVLTAGAIAMLAIGSGTPHAALVKTKAVRPAPASAAVLPSSPDTPGDPPARDFARQLTHAIPADLALYDLRMISDRTAGLYREAEVDMAQLGADLDVPYAVVGHVDRSDGRLRADVQLIDT